MYGRWLYLAMVGLGLACNADDTARDAINTRTERDHDAAVTGADIVARDLPALEPGPTVVDAAPRPIDGPDVDVMSHIIDAPMGPAAGCSRGMNDVPHGGRCRCDQDCESLASCSPEADDGIPGGFCFRSCAQDSDCGDARYECLLIEAGKGACLQKCATTSDCPAGRVCNADTGLCEPLCAGNDECESGVCDPYRALCRTATVVVGARGLMAVCTRDDECRSGTCHALSRRCTTSCRVSRPSCPDGGVCQSAVGGGDGGLCFPPCLAGGSCSDRSLQCATFPNGSRACGLPTATSCLGAAAQRTYAGNCSCPGDCPQDAECQVEDSLGNPNGFCLKRCTPGSTECGPGFICSRGGGCERACTSDADCPDGDLCAAVLKACFNVCQSDSQCLGGKCNLNTGFCQARVPFGNPAGRTLGSECTVPNDCRSGRCWLARPGVGVCISFCDVRKQVCPDGAFCSDDGDGDNIGWCLKTCATNAQCVQTQTRCTLAGATGLCRPF